MGVEKKGHKKARGESSKRKRKPSGFIPNILTDICKKIFTNNLNFVELYREGKIADAYICRLEVLVHTFVRFHHYSIQSSFNDRIEERNYVILKKVAMNDFLAQWFSPFFDSRHPFLISEQFSGTPCYNSPINWCQVQKFGGNPRAFQSTSVKNSCYSKL